MMLPTRGIPPLLPTEKHCRDPVPDKKSNAGAGGMTDRAFYDRRYISYHAAHDFSLRRLTGRN